MSFVGRTRFLWRHPRRTGQSPTFIRREMAAIRDTEMLLRLTAFQLAVALCAFAGPPVTLQSTTTLDSSGIFFVSYDGLVNVESFQQNALLSYQGYQYAVWYNSGRSAMIARRQLPSGGWSSIKLPHSLAVNDSHNVISIGVSPEDGRIHVAMDTHSTQLYYLKSVAGLATNPGSFSWATSNFSGSFTSTLGSLNVGGQVTYPQFAITPTNKLQFIYRSGVSGNGACQLAEYEGSSGSWSNVGQWSSASGGYTAPSGSSSSTRNLYIHGFTYRGSRLHVSGTWREGSQVQCSSGGLSNHDTIYIYSDDRGRTWKNTAGSTVATSGSNPLSVSASGIIVDPLDPDHGLMNQESQAVDSSGNPHIIISYVPGRFGQCVTSYASQRNTNGRSFHVWRNTSGTWQKVEIPISPGSTGRSQIVIDSQDNIYVVMPFLKIVSASKSSGWTDWSTVYTGSNVFGEVTWDRMRQSSDGILSVLYQDKSSGTTPSAVKVADFKLN
ncbi:hypothetical protein FRC03_001295 [Tulasnella sp. 419]|nr:hypothetical protein FRC03_001295 [Tulasnella sp. 419]